MKKFLKVLGGIFAVLLVTAIVFGVGYFFGNRSNGGKAEVVPASSSGIDLKLPGEVEKSIITVDEVEAKILEIGELVTAALENIKKEEVTCLEDVLNADNNARLFVRERIKEI